MSTYFRELKSLQATVLSPAFDDFMRSMPDSIFLGSSIFSLLTQNFPLGIFVLAMIEFGIVHRLLGGLIGAIESNNEKERDGMCIPGIPSVYQITIIGKLLSEVAFPSGPIYFMSAVIGYTLTSILNFRQELYELGKKESEWALRIPMSFMFSFLLLIIFILWRYAYSCDGLFTILGSTALGLLLGGAVHLIHVYLFGRDSINFLGVPLLADRAANGKPLYVCAKQQKE
jgi:NADH:ubiquinone oxidoreductase subunit 3 (subunit A)